MKDWFLFSDGYLSWARKRIHREMFYGAYEPELMEEGFGKTVFRYLTIGGVDSVKIFQ